MNRYSIEQMPDDVLPAITDLTGDLYILAEMVGVRKALEISERFDSTPIRLYGHKKWLRRWRDQCMREEYDQGNITVVELARRHNMGERQTFNILGKEPVDDRQLSLW